MFGHVFSTCLNILQRQPESPLCKHGKIVNTHVFLGAFHASYCFLKRSLDILKHMKTSLSSANVAVNNRVKLFIFGKHLCKRVCVCVSVSVCVCVSTSFAFQAHMSSRVEPSNTLSSVQHSACQSAFSVELKNGQNAQFWPFQPQPRPPQKKHPYKIPNQAYIHTMNSCDTPHLFPTWMGCASCVQLNFDWWLALAVNRQPNHQKLRFVERKHFQKRIITPACRPQTV